MTAFDRLSELLIHYARERIQLVTKGLKLNSSKWAYPIFIKYDLNLLAESAVRGRNY